MSTAYEYKICYGQAMDIEEQVKELSEGGWELHGNHQMTHLNGKAVYSQAMVKEFESPGAWG